MFLFIGYETPLEQWRCTNLNTSHVFIYRYIAELHEGERVYLNTSHVFIYRMGKSFQN